MRARIVKIGNSRGIRIPKPLLDQSGIINDVELEVEKNQITIRPVKNVRSGWNNAFKLMTQNDDDALVDGEIIFEVSW